MIQVTRPMWIAYRAAMITLQDKSRLKKLTSLSLCAGFDMVAYSDALYIQVFVQQQKGFYTTYVPFLHDQVHEQVVITQLLEINE